MDQYDNPKVSLVVASPTKPKEKPEDKLFFDPFTCNFDEFGNVVTEEKEGTDEDIRIRLLRPFEPRGFLVQPSWVNVYYDLKMDNPKLALKYLEGLLDLGSLGIEPPRDTEEDRTIYNLLDGPMNVINKEYASFCRERNARRKREEEKRTKKLNAELDKRNKRRWQNDD